MRKKYLKTIKDIDALRNTDTVIHYGCDEKYVLKFVNGVLCSFYKENTDHLKQYLFNLDIDIHQPYIEVEYEPSEDDIGKLGWFWDEYREDKKFIDVLESLDKRACFKYKAKSEGGPYQFFQPLTPEEVEKYTGYKVVKED